MISRLLSELPDSAAAPQDLVHKGQVLDNLYVPTRYPDSHVEGAPHDHYGPIQSEEAVRYAGEILAFVRAQMARAGGR